MINPAVKYQKLTLKNCLRNFHTRFQNIPVSRVAEILVKLGHGNEVIWWVNVTQPDRKFSWSAGQFGKDLNTCKLLARQIKNVEFYGGPPGYLCNHTGTLLTVFMDRLLLAVARGGYNALDTAIPLKESYL